MPRLGAYTTRFILFPANLAQELALYAALFQAAEQNDLGKVQHLLAEGLDVQVRNQHGATLLHVASEPQMLSLLLSKGANPKQKDGREQTPLMRYGLSALANQILIQAGVALHAADKEGYTALHHQALARCIGWINPDFGAILVLLKAGLNPNVKWRGQSVVAEAETQVCSALEYNEWQAFRSFMQKNGWQDEKV